MNIDTPDYIRRMNKDFGTFVEMKKEFSALMVEVLPSQPFSSILDIRELWNHFNFISKTFSKGNGSGEKLLVGGSILPHVGTLTYYIPPDNIPVPLEIRESLNTISGSTTFLDSTIMAHPRFKSLTLNVKTRRGSKPEIHVPIYQDIKTQVKELVKDHRGYGMGCLALQVTFSCKSMDDYRFLYDQMHVLSPFVQTLSNSSAIANGKLIDLDSRWKIIEQSTDNRKLERGEDSRRVGIALLVSIFRTTAGIRLLTMIESSPSTNGSVDLSRLISKRPAATSGMMRDF